MYVWCGTCQIVVSIQDMHLLCTLRAEYCGVALKWTPLGPPDQGVVIISWGEYS